MTDDELERALFALPLEEPPAGLHERILAATIARPRLSVAAWEVWAVGTLTAFVVWLAFMVATSVPDLAGSLVVQISGALDRLAAALTPAGLMWMGLGVSFAVWVSTLTLPATRRTTADR